MKDALKIFLLLSLSLFILGAWFFEIEEEVLEKSFPEDTILNFDCSFPLSGGSFETDNISLFCQNEELPSHSLSLILEDFTFSNDRVLGVVRYFSKEETVFLVGLDRKEGHFDSYLLEEDFQVKEGKVKIGEKEIRIVGDKLEEISKERVTYASPLFSFKIDIPSNWEAKREGEKFIFGHSDSIEDFPLTLSFKEGDYNFHFPERNPYQDIHLELEESFKSYYKTGRMPDYSFFKEGLDDFLEINTYEKKLYKYEKGEIEIELPMLAAIDPEGWGGAPEGLYQILSKEGLRFSTVSRLYMPHSIRFYGKYLIHGEPYYPSGIPFVSSFSGGCIRIENEKIASLYEDLEVGLPVLVRGQGNKSIDFFGKGIAPFPNLLSESILVADINSGDVFFEREIEKVRPIASLTKLMTAIVATEHFDLNSSIVIRDYMLTGHGSTRGIYPGRAVRLADLLHPLLGESSNNAAKVMAHFLGRDTNLKRMNEKADHIGMFDTRFTDPSGFDPGNVSSARDIYYLIRYINNVRSPLLSITASKPAPLVNYAAFPNLKNQNYFENDPNFLGGKSGFTLQSGYTGVFLFQIEGREVAIILLNSKGRDLIREEVTGIYNWLEESFKN